MNKLNNGDQITLNKLIDGNGNWDIRCVYNNYGNNVLLLLPNSELEFDCVDNKLNHACTILTQLEFYEADMYKQWIQDYSDLPFVTFIKNDDIKATIDSVEEKLCKYNGDWNKFTKDCEIFNDFRYVAFMVVNNSGSEYQVFHEGWKSLIQEAREYMEEYNK